MEGKDLEVKFISFPFFSSGTTVRTDGVRNALWKSSDGWIPDDEKKEEETRLSIQPPVISHGIAFFLLPFGHRHAIPRRRWPGDG